MRSWEEQHNQDFGLEHIRSFRRQDHSIPNLINPDKNKSVLSLPHFLKGQFILLVTQANNLKIIQDLIKGAFRVWVWEWISDKYTNNEQTKNKSIKIHFFLYLVLLYCIYL